MVGRNARENTLRWTDREWENSTCQLPIRHNRDCRRRIQTYNRSKVRQRVSKDVSIMCNAHLDAFALIRILEFEPHLDKSGDNRSSKVELWDCSGDFKFESCWPAIIKDCNGVVIVFNPDVPSHLKEIETWHGMFISSQGLQDSQCLLIAHHKPGCTVEEGRLSLDLPLTKHPLIHSNLEEEPEDVRKAFIRYLGNVVKAMSESWEREEMSIIM
uniref:Intraflagellar transport 22 homolog (Chlamydomonas) n=1 Tax=Neogobius melanostomus TaxID=47308 RepID=A0A8C6UPB3_9GOBI